MQNNNISNEDEKKFLKVWEYLPKDVKDFFNSIAISASLAMSNTEKEIFSQDNGTNTGNYMQQNNSAAKDFLQNLKGGIRDEQYIKYFYEVLQKADNYIDSSDSKRLNEARMKYGMIDEGDNTFEFGQNNHKVREKDENVEIVFKNSYTVRNQYEVFMGAPEMRVYMLNVNGSVNRYYSLGEYAEYLEVIKTSNHNRKLRFFVPKNFGFDGKNFTMMDDFVDCKYVSFTNQNGMKFYYNVNNFVNIESNELYYILSFEGNKLDVQY